MTNDDFRRIVLEFPKVVESSHMGHPDFRVNGKIFATLNYPDENWGMVKLSLEQQDDLARSLPQIFVPVKGAWGRKGSTNVRLEAVEQCTLEKAVRLAWSNLAGKKRKVGPALKQRTGHTK